MGSSASKAINDVRQLTRERFHEGLPDLAISFGIYCTDDSSLADECLEHADEALYEAKRQDDDAARMAT